MLHQTDPNKKMNGCDNFPSPGQMASNEGDINENENDEKENERKDELQLQEYYIEIYDILSATTTAYASLIRHAKELITNFNIELFVLPYSKNDYSEWLARQDPWYNRYIYLPLSNKLFVA
eukprot:508000_1